MIAMKPLWIFFLLLLPVAEPWASTGPPAPVYGLPGMIDLSYQPPAYSELHYGSGNRFALLLSDYLPMPPSGTSPTLKALNLHYLDDEKQRFADSAKSRLEAIGIDTTLLHQRQDKRRYYFHGNNPVCISNNAKSALAFLQAALADTNLSKDVYLQLALTRLALFDVCASIKPKQPDAITQMIDMLPAEAVDYGAYLQASAHFYLGDYGSALSLYQRLAQNSKSTWLNRFGKHLQQQPLAPSRLTGWLLSTQHSNSPWLEETSLYMVARVQLIAAQKNWDGFSEPQAVDKTQLNIARLAFSAYLDAYPDGLYRDSAIGIERKLAFLSANQAELNRLLRHHVSDSLNHALNHPEATPKAYESLDEFRRFFHGVPDFDHDHPMLLAYFVLDQTRFDDDSINRLAKRKQDFTPYHGLFELTFAILQFRLGRLEALATDTSLQRPLTNQAASLATTVLRAQAFEALGNADRAIDLWRELNQQIKDNIAQLQLAGLYFQSNRFMDLVGNDGGIANPRIKADFLHFAFATDALESLSQANSLSADAKTLIHRELLRRYLLTADFKAFYRLLSANSTPPFDKIENAARRLVSNPWNADSLAEIGLFIYDRHITPDSPTEGMQTYFQASSLEDLKPYCTACKLFGSGHRNLQSAYDYLKKAESIYRKRGKKSDTEAQVLHTLTKCFRGFEYRHRCQWEQNNKNTSRQWFDRLHALYPKSDWAAKTPYYY